MAECVQNSANSGPNSTAFGPTWATFGRLRPKVSPIWATHRSASICVEFRRTSAKAGSAHKRPLCAPTTRREQPRELARPSRSGTHIEQRNVDSFLGRVRIRMGMAASGLRSTTDRSSPRSTSGLKLDDIGQSLGDSGPSLVISKPMLVEVGRARANVRRMRDTFGRLRPHVGRCRAKFDRLCPRSD